MECVATNCKNYCSFEQNLKMCIIISVKLLNLKKTYVVKLSTIIELK